MAPKITFFGTFLVLLVITFSALDTVQSKDTKHNSFEFIQNLQGCHKGQNVSGLNLLKKYLEKFGYLNYGGADNAAAQSVGSRGSCANDDEFDELLESAVKSYQRNFHLEATGTLDTATVEKMIAPRCGVRDEVNESTPNPRKVNKNRKLISSVSRYSFFQGNPRWQKTSLTYRFRSTASVPGSVDIRSVCARAFQRWARVSGFVFTEVSPGSAADMEIGFHRGSHGDNDPFDGQLGTLAHAYAPSVGWLHFDADETWSSNPGPEEVDLESVAVHEIGHVLGLGHEPGIPDAIMYPSFSYGTTKRDLHEDDIRGISALYGLN